MFVLFFKKLNCKRKYFFWSFCSFKKNLKISSKTYENSENNFDWIFFWNQFFSASSKKCRKRVKQNFCVVLPNKDSQIKNFRDSETLIFFKGKQKRREYFISWRRNPLMIIILLPQEEFLGLRGWYSIQKIFFQMGMIIPEDTHPTSSENIKFYSNNYWMGKCFV